MFLDLGISLRDAAVNYSRSGTTKDKVYPQEHPFGYKYQS